LGEDGAYSGRVNRASCVLELVASLTAADVREVHGCISLSIDGPVAIIVASSEGTDQPIRISVAYLPVAVSDVHSTGHVAVSFQTGRFDLCEIAIGVADTFLGLLAVALAVDVEHRARRNLSFENIFIRHWVGVHVSMARTRCRPGKQNLSVCAIALSIETALQSPVLKHPQKFVGTNWRKSEAHRRLYGRATRHCSLLRTPPSVGVAVAVLTRFFDVIGHSD